NLTFHEGDTGDWYLIETPVAVDSFGSAEKSLLTRDMFKIVFDDPETNAFFNDSNYFAETNYFLFAAEVDVADGKIASVVPVEQFSGLPDYYLLHVLNVGSFQVVADSVPKKADGAHINDGKLSGDATITITVNDNPFTVEIFLSETSNNGSIDDLADDVNEALKAAGLEDNVFALVKDFADGRRLVLSLKHPGTLTINFDASDYANELGFGDGQNNTGYAPALDRYQIQLLTVGEGAANEVGNTNDISDQTADATIATDDLSYRPVIIPVGDINGDGFDDFIAAVKDDLTGLGTEVNPGTTFARVFFGSADARDITLSDSTFTLKLPAPVLETSQNTDNLTARAIFSATPGDINGDGIDDIVVALTRTEGKLFDGTLDYVKVSDTATSASVTSALTMSAWIRLDASHSGWDMIMNKENEYEIAVYDGNLYFALNNGAPGWAWVDTGYTVPKEKWIHVAFTYDDTLAAGEEIKLYVDGNEEYRRAGSGDINYTGTKRDLYIGARPGSNPPSTISMYFQGSINDVMVWNSALSVTEVRALAVGVSPIDAVATWQEDYRYNDGVYVLFGNSAWNADTDAIDIVRSNDVLISSRTPGLRSVDIAGDIYGDAIDDLLVTRRDNIEVYAGRAGWGASLDIFSSTDGSGFTINGIENNLWHQSATGRQDDAGHSNADGSLYFGQGEGSTGGGTYYHVAGRTAGELVSTIPIDLSIAGTVQLSFNYFLETEPGVGDFDKAIVEIFDGAVWSTLVANDGTTGSLVDPTAGWQSATFSLNSYIGQTIQLKFSFDSVDDLFNDLEGWYVDDVVVTNFVHIAPDITLSVPDLKLAAGVGNATNDSISKGDIAVLTSDGTTSHVYIDTISDIELTGFETGVQTNLYYYDADASTDYTFGEEVWIDAVLNGMYNAGEEIYDGGDGVWDTAPGSPGTLNDLYFDNSEGDFGYDPGEDLWKDQSGGITGFFDNGIDLVIFVPTVSLSHGDSLTSHNLEPLGDIDADGFSDFAVTTESGSFIVWGAANDGTLSANSWAIPKNYLLTGLGDVNGDGIEDFGALALEISPRLNETGAQLAHVVAQVFYGSTERSEISLDQPNVVIEPKRPSYFDFDPAATVDFSENAFTWVGNIHNLSKYGTPGLYDDGIDVPVYDGGDDPSSWDTADQTAGIQAGIHFNDADGNGYYTVTEDIWKDKPGGRDGFYDHNVDQNVYDGGNGWFTSDSVAGINSGLFYADTNTSSDYSTGEEIWYESTADLALTEGLGGEIHVYAGGAIAPVDRSVEQVEAKVTPKHFNFDLATPFLVTIITTVLPGVDIMGSSAPDLTDSFSLEGTSAYEHLTETLAIGDFDGDGQEDFLFHGDGDSYIYLGPLDINSAFDVEQRADFIIDSATFGRPAERMGDIDGDGISDLVFVAIKDADSDSTDETVVYVIFGGRILPRNIDSVSDIEDQYLRTIVIENTDLVQDSITAQVLNWNGDRNAAPNTGGFMEDILIISRAANSTGTYGHIFSGETIQDPDMNDPWTPLDPFTDSVALDLYGIPYSSSASVAIPDRVSDPGSAATINDATWGSYWDWSTWSTKYYSVPRTTTANNSVSITGSNTITDINITIEVNHPKASAS
ncbi:LamG-like jellyroll fold domain-containing protein, partial [Thermodesulfobacteriota bacterium]